MPAPFWTRNISLKCVQQICMNSMPYVVLWTFRYFMEKDRTKGIGYVAYACIIEKGLFHMTALWEMQFYVNGYLSIAAHQKELTGLDEELHFVVLSIRRPRNCFVCECLTKYAVLYKLCYILRSTFCLSVAVLYCMCGLSLEYYTRYILKLW